MSLINREELYGKACDLEAQALSYVGKIVNDETKIEEWRIWSAILAERTAFKHDIFDAPTIEPERKKGEWQITEAYPHNVYCSECHKRYAQTHWEVWKDGSLPRKYCPECGSFNGGNDEE